MEKTIARENTNQNLRLNAPDYLAWHVTQRGEKSFWNKVEAAWQHKEGRGYTLQLETCQINGRMSCAFRWKIPPKPPTTRGAHERPLRFQGVPRRRGTGGARTRLSTFSMLKSSRFCNQPQAFARLRSMWR